MNNTILIIEDDADLREGLLFTFSGDGDQVTGAASKEEGLREIRKGIYDIVLLDCNLPDGTGFELCREVRRESDVPVIMLTARNTEMDEIKALEQGVDDYISKPFSLGVLKARMKRILRERAERKGRGSEGRGLEGTGKGNAGQADTELFRLVSGNIIVNQNTCKVYKGQEEISLSRLEYRLLLYLMENKNHVLSKEQILNRIWDSDGRFVDNNTVSVNISRLRTKIEDEPANPRRIRTVHGIGYIWKDE